MIQRTTITCCKGCRDRYPGCHDKCNTYQEQKRERQALLDQEKSSVPMEKGERENERKKPCGG